jgi:methionyl-tRNA formyltransferase
LIVSWFWTKRLPRELLRVAPAIGVHPSLLPRHRGPDPYFWAIDCGDEVTGVTAHVLDETYDTGAILRQASLRIDPSWNAWTLAKKLDRPSLKVLREVASEYARGTPPAPRAQDDAEATDAPTPTDDLLEIRWNQPAERIARRVRAAAPWPGAFTEIGSETVVLLDVTPTRDFPRALQPGEAAVRKDGTAVVRTADFALELRFCRNEADEALLDAPAIARLLSA